MGYKTFKLVIFTLLLKFPFSCSEKNEIKHSEPSDSGLTPFYWHKNTLRFKYDQSAFDTITFSRGFFGVYFLVLHCDEGNGTNFCFKVSPLELPVSNDFTNRINIHSKRLAEYSDLRIHSIDSLLLPRVKVELFDLRNDSVISKYAVFPRSDSLGLFYFSLHVKKDKDTLFFFRKMDEIVHSIYF